MKNQPVNPNLKGFLDQLATMANDAGAEGVWLIRGAKNARLIYIPDAPVIEAAINKLSQALRDDPLSISFTTDIRLDIADAGVLVILRFPASDGEEPGIEAK